MFGTVRGLTILVAAPARTPDRLRAAHRRIAALSAASLWACVAVSGTVAIVAAAALGGPLPAVVLGVLVVAVSVVRRPKVAAS